MLSIRFPRREEWWVSGKIFQRLFESGVTQGHIPPALQEWLEVADANGGFHFMPEEAEVGERLLAAMRVAAQADLAVLVAPANREERDYTASLREFLEVTATPKTGPSGSDAG